MLRSVEVAQVRGDLRDLAAIDVVEVVLDHGGRLPPRPGRVVQSCNDRSYGPPYAFHPADRQRQQLHAGLVVSKVHQRVRRRSSVLNVRDGGLRQLRG